MDVYSQSDEQAAILAYFAGSIGRFLDIGALDGIEYSNTRALFQSGWGGTLIEPNPVSFLALQENCRGRDDIALVNAAMLTSNGLIPFYCCNPATLSTTSKEQRDFWLQAWPCEYQTIYTAGVTATALLCELPGPYEFVNLDTEGTNWEVLQTLPLRDMGTKLLCVEHENKLDLMRPWLAEQGLLEEVLLNGENLLIGAL